MHPPTAPAALPLPGKEKPGGLWKSARPVCMKQRVRPVRPARSRMEAGTVRQARVAARRDPSQPVANLSWEVPRRRKSMGNAKRHSESYPDPLSPTSPRLRPIRDSLSLLNQSARIIWISGSDKRPNASHRTLSLRRGAVRYRRAAGTSAPSSCWGDRQLAGPCRSASPGLPPPRVRGRQPHPSGSLTRDGLPSHLPCTAAFVGHPPHYLARRKFGHRRCPGD